MSGRLESAKKIGRPRTMTLEKVIDAACQIGLDNLDMTTLAKRLGVGVATLYNYVENRDHLLRLVAAQLTGSGRIVDRGQGWEDALREYAIDLFQSYSSWPQLMVLQLNGQVGDPTEFSTPDALLKILISRGLTPLEAMQAYSQVTQIVAGAVLAATCYNRLRDEAGSDEMFAAKLEASCQAKGYTALQAGLNAIGLERVAVDFRPSLERLIADQTARMAVRAGGGASVQHAERNEP